MACYTDQVLFPICWGRDEQNHIQKGDGVLFNDDGCVGPVATPVTV